MDNILTEEQWIKFIKRIKYVFNIFLSLVYCKYIY